MIRDLVVNLSLAAERDPAAEFALSVASTFTAHAAGIAFQYDPIMPAALIDDVPPDVIDTQRAENERAANAATSRFRRCRSRRVRSLGDPHYRVEHGGCRHTLRPYRSPVRPVPQP